MTETRHGWNALCMRSHSVYIHLSTGSDYHGEHARIRSASSSVSVQISRGTSGGSVGIHITYTDDLHSGGLYCSVSP